jgi:hypothetical protein
MFEMLFSVYCVFGFKMMIWTNGMYALIGGSISMEFIDGMDMSWFGVIRACII